MRCLEIEKGEMNYADYKPSWSAERKLAYMRKLVDDPAFKDHPSRKVFAAYLNAEAHGARCIEVAEADPTPDNLRALVTSMELEHEARLSACRFVLNDSPWHKKPLIWFHLVALEWAARPKLRKAEKMLLAALGERS